MLLCKQVPIALRRPSLYWSWCFVYVQNSRMKLLWVAIRGTRKGRFNSYMLILIAHQRESINHNQFPATVSLLCDHHTQLLSLNCIPFLPFSPFSPWSGVEWISSLPTLCYSFFIVSGTTPLRLSPMSSSTRDHRINTLRHHNKVVHLHGQCTLDQAVHDHLGHLHLAKPR